MVPKSCEAEAGGGGEFRPRRDHRRSGIISHVMFASFQFKTMFSISNHFEFNEMSKVIILWILFRGGMGGADEGLSGPRDGLTIKKNPACIIHSSPSHLVQLGWIPILRSNPQFRIQVEASREHSPACSRYGKEILPLLKVFTPNKS